MGRPKIPRPADWSEEFVLGWLHINPARDVQDLCEEIAPRCGIGVTAATVYLDILRWRRENREFAEEYRALLTARAAPLGPAPWSHDAINPDWRQQWAIAYLRDKSYLKAAAACGMHHDTLWRKRKVGHPEFDQEFYDIWCGVLEAIKEHYEDVLHWALEESVMQGDAKTAGNLAITILERVDKARWTRAEDRSVKIDQNVHVTVELGEGAQRAMRAAELLSNRIAGALAPGPLTIDVPARRVEEPLAAPAPATTNALRR